MENTLEIIKDLKHLHETLVQSKQSYQSASQSTESIELESLFLNFSSQRDAFLAQLQQLLSELGAKPEQQNRSLLPQLQHIWTQIKQNLASDKDIAILKAIENHEKTTLEAFDQVLDDPEVHAEHLQLLQRQRTGIRECLSEIETYRQRLEKLSTSLN